MRYSLGVSQRNSTIEHTPLSIGFRELGMKIFLRLARNVLTITLLGSSAVVMAQSDVDLSSQESQISYAIGANVGQSLNAQAILEGLELDLFIFWGND